jgi:two-component system chemotaxis sensor kinase CheA
MIDDDEQFLSDLMETFREDAGERIKLLAQAVVELDAGSGSDGGTAQAPLEVFYREIHSLKGASGAVEQTQMEAICQNVESVLAALKRGGLLLTPEVVDVLSESVDRLHASLIAESEADERAAELVQRLADLASAAPAKKAKDKTKTPAPASSAGEQKGPDEARAADPTATTDSVRVSIAKLESIMLQAEEFISVKLSSAQRSLALQDVRLRLETWKRELYQARVSGDRGKIDEFLDWNNSLVEGLVVDLRMLTRAADDERRTIGPLVDELLDSAKRVLMLPVSSLLSSFPKMVRDLARSGGKEADLVLKGVDIEIDKRIIENLKDPLTHILRNSVDHGIETPEVRQRLGKPARGRISITVSQLENNNIELCVSDDGAGVDMERLRAVVQAEGVHTKKQLDEMGDVELLRLAFASGISTSRQVSTVSGRGLGLAIVDQKIRQLGGSVVVETQAGLGTFLRMYVPATLATARGILAQVSDWLFVVPVVGVDRVVRVHRADVRMIENRETIQVEGRTLPLVRMNEVLELPLKPQRATSDHIQALVLGSGEGRIAFAVDQVVDEQEVLVKTLGPQLLRVRNIAGVTVIGSGKVVPILNVVDLIQSSVAKPARGRRPTAEAGGGAARRAVLIVEDSITSRMLLKNVLEAAGYYVRPTVDGVDALAALREEEFDLVVSDIEMPRMDGFELTKKIRSDTQLARIPVLLVTALESQEDRERGLEAGANAYLPKSSFTQGTLLKTARSLL